MNLGALKFSALVFLGLSVAFLLGYSVYQTSENLQLTRDLAASEAQQQRLAAALKEMTAQLNESSARLLSGSRALNQSSDSLIRTTAALNTCNGQTLKLLGIATHYRNAAEGHTH